MLALFISIVIVSASGMGAVLWPAFRTLVVLVVGVAALGTVLLWASGHAPWWAGLPFVVVLLAISCAPNHPPRTPTAAPASSAVPARSARPG